MNIIIYNYDCIKYIIKYFYKYNNIKFLFDKYLCNCHKSRPWTLLHSPLEVTHPSHGLSHHTVSHRSLKDYISHHPLHQHSCLHWSRTHLQTITQSPSPNHTHTHTLHKPWTFSHSLPSIVSLATYKAFPWFLSLFPVFPSILGLISCVLILPVPLDYSLCLAHWIKFADRRPTLALGLFSASSLIYLFATVWPCLYRLCSGIKACRWIRMSHVSSAM